MPVVERRLRAGPGPLHRLSNTICPVVIGYALSAHVSNANSHALVGVGTHEGSSAMQAHKTFDSGVLDVNYGPVSTGSSLVVWGFSLKQCKVVHSVYQVGIFFPVVLCFAHERALLSWALNLNGYSLVRQGVKKSLELSCVGSLPDVNQLSSSEFPCSKRLTFW